MEDKAFESFDNSALGVPPPETYICKEVSSSHRYLYKLTRVIQKMFQELPKKSQKRDHFEDQHIFTEFRALKGKAHMVFRSSKPLYAKPSEEYDAAIWNAFSELSRRVEIGSFVYF